MLLKKRFHNLTVLSSHCRIYATTWLKKIAVASLQDNPKIRTSLSASPISNELLFIFYTSHKRNKGGFQIALTRVYVQNGNVGVAEHLCDLRNIL